MIKIMMVITLALSISSISAFENKDAIEENNEILWIDDTKSANVEEVKSVKYNKNKAMANRENSSSGEVYEVPFVEEEIVVVEEDILYDTVEEIVYEEYIEEEVYVDEVYEYEVFEESDVLEEVYVEEEVLSQGIQFEATAYAIGGWAVPSTMTAMGTEISNTIYTSSGYRIIATDPNVIPMGTVVRVTYADGTTFLAQADDTGGLIVGNRIDILYDNVDDALVFGRQNVTVEFIN